MGIRIGAISDRLSASLFVVPMLSVIAGAALGLAMVEVDRIIGDTAADLPFVLTTTVRGAREVLGVVASATVTVAGIAFSISLLVIQQASAQFSPRVVHSLFRDPFNRRVMGMAVGTFTYCLMVLRAVRSPLDEGGDAVVPHLSVGLSVLLGVAAILAIVAFIDHNAHTLEVSEILDQVTNDTITRLQDAWPERRGERSAPERIPIGSGHTVTFRRSGWLQQLSSEGLLALVPDGGTVRLETSVGRYAVEGTPFCTVWPPPDDEDDVADRAAHAARLGPVRTMQQDPSYGVRQLADVALIALSPGINDPTTAQDAIFHLAAVLREALVRDPPALVERDDHGRRLLRTEDHTHETMVQLAFDEVRRTAAALPAVCIYILESLHLLDEALRREGLPERTAVLRTQADLVLAGAERADLLPEDLAEVRAAFDRRFEPDATRS